MDFYINQSLILVSCMKVLKRISQQILTFLLTSQYLKNSFKFSLIQTMPLVLAKLSVARVLQLRLPLRAPTAPHKKVDFTKRYQKKDRVVVNELDEYFKLTREDFDTCEPLNWWRGRRSQFPQLYRLVIDIFSIPGKLHMVICIY